MRLPVLLALVLLAAAASAQPSDPPGLGFAFRPGAPGLLISVLADDGPAGPAGLQVDDLVTAVSGKSMVGLEPAAIGEWFAAVNRSGLPVTLDVVRNGVTFKVEIAPAPYDRAALQAKVEAAATSPATLEGRDDEEVAALDAAMNLPPTPRRVTREGDDLVIASTICTVRIPVPSVTAVEPSETSATYFKVTAENIRVKCSGEPYTVAFTNFDSQTRETRDRAIQAFRAVVQTWNRGQASPPSAQTPDCIAGECTDGTGTRRYPDGATFTGTFRDGLPTRGLYRMTNGSTYEGEFNTDGKFDGEGLYTFGPGDYEGHAFQGTFSGGQPTAGTYTWANGQTYTGDWDGWTRTGHGTMVYASGNRYEGEWQGGQRAGQGTYTWTDGMVYTGRWANDARHGHGVMTWPSGQRYEGDHKADKRSGYGTMTYADGRVYTGTWSESAPVEGTLQHPGASPRPVRNDNGTFVYTDE